MRFGAKLKKNNMLEVRTTAESEIGRKTFHPSRISWSYLYLGTKALTIANI